MRLRSLHMAHPRPSSLRGSSLGTRAAEHTGVRKLTDGCRLKSCVCPHLLAYATGIKSTQLHILCDWVNMPRSYVFFTPPPQRGIFRCHSVSINNAENSSGDFL